MKKQHEIIMEVRDYECDMADGVNNAVYLNYLEHGRLSALKCGDIDYAALARQRIGLVTIRIEVEYLCSLISGDKFTVKTVMNRMSRLRFEFIQEITRIKDNKLVLRAKSIGTAVNEKGRPYLSSELQEKFNVLCSNTPAALHDN